MPTKPSRRDKPSQNIHDYYPGGAPKIIQVAFQHGFGPGIIALNQKVYWNDDLSFSPLIREAVQGVYLSHCENAYCTIMHARGMMVEGLSLAEVKEVIMGQRLPAHVPDRAYWEPALRRISVLSQEPKLAPALYRSLDELLSPQQVDDVGAVVAFSLLHKFLLERYSDEIVIEDEPILFATIDQGDLLIKTLRHPGQEESPLLTLCSICKDVRTQSGWRPIESAIADIPPASLFSHGFCESCADRWMTQDDDEEAEESAD